MRQTVLDRTIGHEARGGPKMCPTRTKGGPLNYQWFPSGDLDQVIDWHNGTNLGMLNPLWRLRGEVGSRLLVLMPG